jgi:hydroxypyruvate reductase
MPDPSTFEDALAVLERRGGGTLYAQAVVELLDRGHRGEVPETPKPGEPSMTRSSARIIGGRMTAIEGAAKDARARGFDVHIIERPIVGEARDAARAFSADVHRAAASLRRPACVIGGGETTVHVRGSGLGGRNQEFALAILTHLEGAESAGLHCAFGSIGTDGIDGPTDAAGAIADTTTAARAAALGLDPQIFLDNNDSYHFFSALDDLLRTGQTGTNVGDVQVTLIA